MRRFPSGVRWSWPGTSPLRRPVYARFRKSCSVGAPSGASAYQDCRGWVGTSTTRRPRSASAAAKFAATVSCISPTGAGHHDGAGADRSRRSRSPACGRRGLPEIPGGRAPRSATTRGPGWSTARARPAPRRRCGCRGSNGRSGRGAPAPRAPPAPPGPGRRPPGTSGVGGSGVTSSGSARSTRVANAWGTRAVVVLWAKCRLAASIRPIRSCRSYASSCVAIGVVAGSRMPAGAVAGLPGGALVRSARRCRAGWRADRGRSAQLGLDLDEAFLERGEGGLGRLARGQGSLGDRPAARPVYAA